MKLDFIKLSPTRNMTVVVTSPVPRSLHGGIAARLISSGSVSAEQAAFIEPPTMPGAKYRLQMMGGEFCGNACMCAAALIAREDGLCDGGSRVIPVEISGAERPVECAVTRSGEGWDCRVDMPEPVWIGEMDGRALVRLPGIAHFIAFCDDPEALRAGAEGELARRAAALDEDAVGLMLYGKGGDMLPLVYVKSTGTMVWEHGCGSGSAALAAYMAWKTGGSVDLRLRQPGGVMGASAEWNGKLTRLRIAGRVEIVCEGVAYV